jgi:hypothetical protein
MVSGSILALLIPHVRDGRHYLPWSAVHARPRREDTGHRAGVVEFRRLLTNVWPPGGAPALIPNHLSRKGRTMKPHELADTITEASLTWSDDPGWEGWQFRITYANGTDTEGPWEPEYGALPKDASDADLREAVRGVVFTNCRIDISPEEVTVAADGRSATWKRDEDSEE